MVLNIKSKFFLVFLYDYFIVPPPIEIRFNKLIWYTTPCSVLSAVYTNKLNKLLVWYKNVFIKHIFISFIFKLSVKCMSNF